MGMAPSHLESGKAVPRLDPAERSRVRSERSQIPRWLAAGLVFGGAALVGSAAPLHCASEGHRVHLLELYSSEGCSSCPPAERWFGELRTAPRLWRDFVPVAFHVGYWDHLGWPDRWARPDFTARQRAYAAAWPAGSVYTPAFVLNGAEWRGGPGRAAPAASIAPAEVLTVDYDDEGNCHVRFGTGNDGEVHAALLGGGIVSTVTSGENGGRTLRHDFVALELRHARLEHGAATLVLPREGTRKTPIRALAVWVTRGGTLEPLQATGGWVE